MIIHYTLHALERMKQRGIDRELVYDCLRNPDKEEEIGNSLRCVKKLNGKVLVVIYERVNDTAIVITVYITSKIHKYLS
ncbi:MAG: DUF4258 domain-containing protein [Caldisphaeraceae archaeon]|nr:DUF4258 domain-containing protein [Caldisphaeraceae archaeon]